MKRNRSAGRIPARNLNAEVQLTENFPGIGVGKKGRHSFFIEMNFRLEEPVAPAEEDNAAVQKFAAFEKRNDSQHSVLIGLTTLHLPPPAQKMLRGSAAG